MMSLSIVLLSACGGFGLEPQVGPDGEPWLYTDTGDPGAAAGIEDTGTDPVPDFGDDCALLEVAWVPAVGAATHVLAGELVDAGGEQVLIWDELDQSTGTGQVAAAWEVCGLAFRGIGATDIDGDGQDDSWSAVVSGDACTSTGQFTCALGGQPFPPTMQRRDDGCSSWCVPPELAGLLP